ncbi:hypothetical protein CK218_01200 [Mesorhizobium sp. WSM3879]|nr:hypothetical protein CK218_01200 [Mesorhizobium sp. WSM3879]
MGTCPRLHNSRKAEAKREFSWTTATQTRESAALCHRAWTDRSMPHLRCRLLADDYRFILV